MSMSKWCALRKRRVSIFLCDSIHVSFFIHSTRGISPIQKHNPRNRRDTRIDAEDEPQKYILSAVEERDLSKMDSGELKRRLRNIFQGSITVLNPFSRR